MHCSSSLLQLSDVDFRAGTSSLDVCVRDMCAFVRGVYVRMCVCMCMCVRERVYACWCVVGLVYELACAGTHVL